MATHLDSPPVARARRQRRLLGRSGLLYLGAAILIVVVVGGIAIHLLEPDRVVTVWDGFWLMLATLATVGYGDITPVTFSGRVLTGTVMLLGVATFASVAILMAEMLLERDIERDERRLERIERKLDELSERLDGRSPD